MDLSYSDSDFEKEAGGRRRGSSSSSLRSAINRDIPKARTNRERQSDSSGFAYEVAERFPFHYTKFHGLNAFIHKEKVKL